MTLLRSIARRTTGGTVTGSRVVSLSVTVAGHAVATVVAALALALLAMLWAAVFASPARAQAAGASTAAPAGPSARAARPFVPWVLGTQFNLITQNLRPLRSPYAGVNSLLPNGDTQTTHAYGVYLGTPVVGGLQLYVDVEMLRGKGVSNASGLAGVTNGDVIRQGTVDLGENPYIARAFARYVIGLPGAGVDSADAAIDQIATAVPTRRVEFTAGRFALTDIIDVSRYATSTRLQFQNWALFNNSAWDYAADTRGYTNAVGLAWIEPRWALRVASGQMPTEANGNVFDSHVRDAHGDQVELTVLPNGRGTVVRALAYLNHGRMGNYADALRVARVLAVTPDIKANGLPGRTKRGFGLNLEQPLADGGETGLFARLGWSDGHNESFVFTEVDRGASVGVQVAGTSWQRPHDRLGIGFVHHELSDDHRDYLAAGGIGFLLGDGRLTYGAERIIEAYYRIQLGRFVQVSPDVQHIWNPGYNQDRGPATVYALRFNARY
ncbi:MAG: hypothetical protein NVS1B4_19140 [Gemmatimonadaceae bacterium]